MSWLKKAAITTLYHGTNVDLSNFNLDFAGQRDWGDLGIGVYLAKSPTLAAIYAEETVEEKGGRPRVYVVRADISNTANLDDVEIQEKIKNGINVPFPKYVEPGQPQSRPKIDSSNIANFIQSLGYDSASLYDGAEIVVYDTKKLHIVQEYPWEDIR